MRTGWFLRIGCAVVFLTGAAGVASAFDPNGVEDDAAALPNVRALAPLPTPGRVGVGPTFAPAALSAPPGVSAKLLPGPVVPPSVALSAEDEFRSGTRLYYAGDRKAALEQLRRAAEHGHPIAQWKLGKMYETGDGVPVNDAKAVAFYREVIDNHADDARGTPQAAFVASAFVALGSYYLKGVENAAIRPNVDRARELYTYAASIFGDTEAQYRLGRLYLEASGDERDPRQAARWLTVAAKKGHCGAQAMLGQLLFTGDEGFSRRPVQGLMWLTIARANATGATADDWIREVQEQVFSVASEPERRRGVADAQDWIAKAGSP
ncbi:MAG: sel1 repeat family protein [Hyphomicrobiales bacterium]|nr:sel1 repeat family protein [Hyphomicrobiales bacterium]